MASVLAMLLCSKNKTVRMWGYEQAQLKEIEAQRENKKFLPGYKLPEQLIFVPRDEQIIAEAELIVSAVPCQYMRSVWERLKPHLPKDVPVVSVAKGLENDTLLLPTQIIGDVTGADSNIAVLSGPTIADELARRLPATACIACDDQQLARNTQYVFSTDWFRIYTNKDIIGVQLAAACKNVIAIAAGIIDGIGAGDNAKAALLSRGLAEISRLGRAYGAKRETFAGLTGLGDLVTTCISPKGRNRSFGERIGKGQNAADARKTTESVIEGASTCKSVCMLAKKLDVEMPITTAVYEIIFENKPVNQAITELMRRKLKEE